jgi:ectoine hydroxylase-related dioxygenase (phytanoyl-CoA dioxygenase family)
MTAMAADLEARGFDIVNDILGSDETERAKSALAAVDGRSRAGARHLMRDPAVANLAATPALIQIASEGLSADAVPYRVTFFDKSRLSNWLVVWHQDKALPLRERHSRPGWGPWSHKAGILYAHAPADALSQVIALRVHIDDSRADNGALRVLPGTHRLGVLTDEAMARLRSEIPAAPCVVPAGGVMVMRPLIVHASSKSETEAPRRVLHIEYASPTTIETLGLAIA